LKAECRRWLIHGYWVNKRRLGLLNVSSGEKADLLKHPKFILAHPRFSPDDRWIVFVARTGPNRARLVVVPFQEGSTPAETDWIPITDDAAWIISPGWSPGGALVYFAGDRDGFHCVWTQRLDSATKRPLGPPAPLRHFHNARRSLFGNISVARDKLALDLTETTGNIWMAKLEGPK
jgi:hypothetical protein